MLSHLYGLTSSTAGRRLIFLRRYDILSHFLPPSLTYLGGSDALCFLFTCLGVLAAPHPLPDYYHGGAAKILWKKMSAFKAYESKAATEQ